MMLVVAVECRVAGSVFALEVDLCQVVLDAHFGYVWLRNRAIIESINNLLKDHAQIELSQHRRAKNPLLI